MNVFEKIKKRLETMIFSAELYNDDFNGQTVENLICFGDAVEIIDQVAEEDNNGWIPVEERLPEKGGKYLTCDEHGNVHIFSFKNGLFYDEFLHRITNYHNRYNVPITWKPLPEPYQKGE